MSVVNFALTLGIIWAIIHGIYYFFKPSRAQSLLPSSTLTRTRRDVWNSSTTHVTVKILHLRIHTSAGNLLHDLLATAFKRRRNYSCGLKMFYDFGSALGVLGMGLGVALLLWTCVESAQSLASKVLQESARQFGASTLAKRDPLAEVSKPTLRAQHDSLITPIIPGVTVPLGDLPLILIAVFFAQIFHEFGHAVAAALESLPMLLAGASFTLIIPSAFVTFSTAALQALPPRARSRIVAAGPFHNIVLWCILLLVQSMGISNIFWCIGYKDVSNSGRVVVSVDPGSPLHIHLPSGSLITKLDDMPLGSVNTSQDLWTYYLKSPMTPDQRGNMGWCTEKVLEGSDLCCGNKKAPHLACFVLEDSSMTGCLDPVPILTARNGGRRCSSNGDCTTDSMCVVPDIRENFLRLSLHRPGSNDGDIVLWSGPTQEVWEDVKVGTLLPRFSVLPLWLPDHLHSFYQYLIMGTLSLFFFNLLPLPYLDGSQLLATILETNFQHNADEFGYDIESLDNPQRERSMRDRGRWKRRLTIAISRSTICVCICCVTLGIIDVWW